MLLFTKHPLAQSIPLKLFDALFPVTTLESPARIPTMNPVIVLPLIRLRFLAAMPTSGWLVLFEMALSSTLQSESTWIAWEVPPAVF